MNENDRSNLLQWYKVNHRDLPWRKSRDPYKIWISETMLQQTTTTAVLRFYDRFLKRFPTLSVLANAEIESVYELWAGLGYYSRARNLHQAARMLAKIEKFPRTHVELLEYPGFGPYTARAVSSLAFSEPVGVLDGNVIRVLSRKENLDVEWWRPKEREKLQKLVDAFVAKGPSHELNQALMELGSQICVPKTPHCAICPWLKSCRSRKAGTIAARPLKRVRKPNEKWIWTPHVQIHNGAVKLELNRYAPFLRGAWFLPGAAKKVELRPERYDFRHSVTHHDIFVQLTRKNIKVKKGSGVSKSQTTKSNAIRWVKLKQLQKFVPASLVRKAIQHVIENEI